MQKKKQGRRKNQKITMNKVTTKTVHSIAKKT